MPSFRWIKVSNCGDGAKAKGKVGKVYVWKADNLGAQVIGDRGEDAIEWPLEGGVILEEHSKFR